MAPVLIVSKPIEPPWNDSSKNLVRDLLLGLREYQAIALGRRGGPTELGLCTIEPIHPPGHGKFAPGAGEQARVLRRLLFGRRAALWHFFFAPNPRTSTVARILATARRTPTVQTVCSVPKHGTDLDGVLFGDRVVVLSRHTERWFLDAGVAPSRLRRIAPAVPELTPLTQEAMRKVRAELGLSTDLCLLLYPGDLEFGSGASLMIEAHAKLPAHVELVLACRAKTERAVAIRVELEARTRELGTSSRVRFLGETPRILELLGSADVIALPSEVAYAKMDYPLVLLEAMALEKAVVVCSGTPAAELAEGGASVEVLPALEPLVRELAQLIADDAARAKLGVRARAATQERFGRARMAQAYEALYRELV
jgi:phosphatidylinositol alpha-1,6-mannosyltransferase